MKNHPLLKAVLDTNVFLAALLTRSSTSLAAELLEGVQIVPTLPFLWAVRGDSRSSK